MKFSENWLRQHIKTDATREQLAATLTAIGLEVEAMTVLGTSLDGVIVSRIVSVAKHPEAERLQVCQVDSGSKRLQVVCGAPNARAGLIAPLATVGTSVGEITIKATKLRGVESDGMLCSAKELGLDDDASGLLELPADAPVGTPLADYLGLPDASIELKLTPNRADCFSVRGIAVDVAAACSAEVIAFDTTPMPALNDAILPVELNAGADAPRYLGRVIEGVDAARTTPVWMAERLRRSGIRPLGLLVDITQYLMLELGQPMHAFDRDLLHGPLGVRRARAGEAVKLLDGSDVALDEEFLAITDMGAHGAERVVALAGLMGGLHTRVTEATRNVFLEAAYFAPDAIIGRDRKLGLHSDAGQRFERGVDPELPRQAIEVATRLIVELAGGAPGPVIEAVLLQHLPQSQAVTLRRARLAHVLGVSIADGEVERILRALGLAVHNADDGWRVTPPTRRFDLAIEEDLIEEIARIHGYDAIPATLPGGAVRVAVHSETRVDDSTVRRQLAARDYLEAINYAFVGADLLSKWGAAEGAVPLANPLSAEHAMMRTQLLPGLVAALARNAARQQPWVRLFELGKTFVSRESGTGNRKSEKINAGVTSAPSETHRIAAVACGDAGAEQWGHAARAVDFYDLKGDLDSIAALAGATLDYRPSQVTWGHPGRSADVYRDGTHIGWIGQLHPRLQLALALDADVVAFELELSPLLARPLPKVAPLSKYPSVRRDIAFVVAESVPWAAISATVKAAAGPSLRALRVFDRYAGKEVENGCKSLAIGLILQDESRTLTDRDVNTVVAEVETALQRNHDARVRGSTSRDSSSRG